MSSAKYEVSYLNYCGPDGNEPSRKVSGTLTLALQIRNLASHGEPDNLISEAVMHVEGEDDFLALVDTKLSKPIHFAKVPDVARLLNGQQGRGDSTERTTYQLVNGQLSDVAINGFIGQVRRIFAGQDVDFIFNQEGGKEHFEANLEIIKTRIEEGGQLLNSPHPFTSVVHTDAEDDTFSLSRRGKHIIWALVFAFLAVLALAASVYFGAAVTGKHILDQTTHPLVAIGVSGFSQLQQWSGVSGDLLLGATLMLALTVFAAAAYFCMKESLAAHKAKDENALDSDDSSADLEEGYDADKGWYRTSTFFGVLAFLGTVAALATVFIFVMNLGKILGNFGVDVGFLGDAAQSFGFSAVSDLALGIMAIASLLVTGLFVYLTVLAAKKSDAVRISDGQNNTTGFVADEIVPIVEALGPIAGKIDDLLEGCGRLLTWNSAATGPAYLEDDDVAAVQPNADDQQESGSQGCATQ